MVLFPRRLLTRTVQPASEPITLSEAKLYLRVDGNTEDTLIMDMITAVRVAAEEYLRKSLITQSWKLAYNDYLPVDLELPQGPVQSITSISLIGLDGVSSSVSGSSYRLNASVDALLLDTALYSHRIEVVYVAGYGNAAAVPKPIIYGMLAHLAAMYEHRDDAQAGMPNETLSLYMPFREIRA